MLTKVMLCKKTVLVHYNSHNKKICNNAVDVNRTITLVVTIVKSTLFKRYRRAQTIFL